MNTKKIPWSAYLIVGGAMALMSVFIDPVKLLLFILAGLVFIIVGIIKLLLHLKNKDKHKTGHPHSSNHSNLYSHHHTHQTRNQSHSHPQHRSTAHLAHSQTKHKPHMQPAPSQFTLRCSNCGIQLHPNFAHCPHCGLKVNKHRK